MKREKDEPKESFVNALDNFIYFWHQFPIDYWWRKKYNISFNSPQHRQMSLIDIYFEYREEMLIKEYRKKAEEEQDAKENEMLKINNDKEVVKMTKKEIEEDYDNLDLSQFDKIEEINYGNRGKC